MYGVVAFLQAVPGSEAEVEQILNTLVDETRKNEPGATNFKLFRHRKAGDTFVLMEEYESAAAFESHGASAHVQSAFERLQPMLGPNSGIHSLDILK